jgi:hypothetical protein
MAQLLETTLIFHSDNTSLTLTAGVMAQLLETPSLLSELL